MFVFLTNSTKPPTVSLMKNWKWIAGIVLTLFVAGGAGYVGYHIGKPAQIQKPQINAQIILTALKDRGFLVTQTYMFDEPITITKSTGNVFKDFFFGQTITARGVMEVDLGIDLAKVTTKNITINGDTITVTIPDVTLFDDRLIGPINLKNNQGILKRILQNDNGYNEALSALSKQAEAAATQPELISRAHDNASQEITRLLGYVASGKTIVVRTAQ